MRASHCRSRSASRASAWACARTWCAREDGLGVLEVGAARHRHLRVRLGEADERTLQIGQQAAEDPGVVPQVHPEEGGDLVVAGPARAQLAAEVLAQPLQEPALQGAVCTSSSAIVPWKSPEATSRSSASRPSSIRLSSSPVSSPAVCRTRAWAREPAMSYGARRQSKWTDAESFSRASAGPSAKRPPQRRTSSLSALSLFSLLTGGCLSVWWWRVTLPRPSRRTEGRGRADELTPAGRAWRPSCC